MSYRIFALNPGSTSTKIALFEDDKTIFSTKAVHTAEELAKFPKVADQFDYRRQTILDAVAAQGASLEGVDCFIARCSGVYPCEGGIYAVTDKVLEDCFCGYTVHPAILGGKLAWSFAQEYGGVSLFMNPPDSDEFQDVARVTGFHDVYRTSNVHMLNQKETALRAAADLGRKYEDCNFVVAHIGGGVSVTAHRKGRAVDSSSIIMGEGPMTPTRSGALPLVPFMDLCFSGKWTRDEMYDRLTKTGGFVDLLGTSEATEIKDMIASGNQYAKLVYDAFIYQIGKNIGAMAAVLNFDVDAILLTGGISHDELVVRGLKEMCGKIAPFMVYPGEFEMEALCSGALRYLRGEEALKVYTGIPPFTGFDHLKPAKEVK
jgi:butyrate kinase